MLRGTTFVSSLCLCGRRVAHSTTITAFDRFRILKCASQAAFFVHRNYSWATFDPSSLENLAPGDSPSLPRLPKSTLPNHCMCLSKVWIMHIINERSRKSQMGIRPSSPASKALPMLPRSQESVKYPEFLHEYSRFRFACLLPEDLWSYKTDCRSPRSLQK